MANRRMFNKELVSSDKFLDMPVSSQLLFFHLGMNADDEGYVSSPKRIQRSVGCASDDIKILLSKNLIIGFESGVIVITDWEKHNQIRKDRFTKTLHVDEKNTLQGVDFKQLQPNGNQMATKWQPNGNQMATIGKPSVVESSVVESSVVNKNTCLNFDTFWELYGKKEGRKKCELAYKKIKESDREIIKSCVSKYVLSTPEVKFRKNPLTYLNGEHWNDEIINNPAITPQQKAKEREMPETQTIDDLLASLIAN